MKNHNAGGINDSQIAGILCKMDRREEAMTYVGRTVFRSVSDLMMVIGPAIEYYRGVGNVESARAMWNGRRANPCADGKGAGESTPALRAIIYE